MHRRESCRPELHRISLNRAFLILAPLLFGLSLWAGPTARGADPDPKAFQHWLWSKAHRVPAHLTSEESGYFSIVEGLNGHIYVGAAKYGDNGYLIDFDPASEKMKVVVDVEKEIGVDRKGFAAQAKIHTRNNVGKSGRIYFGSKQGYPKQGEKRTDYLGGHPMVFNPKTGKTRVYDIPIKHQGIISVTPDESRGVAYISTCSDERPTESTHFLILDLETGEYRDLMDCRHMYAFIVLDHLGRAYHPILGGDIARYDPRTDKLERLKQTIDGKPPTAASKLADPKSHPINWEVSPDRKTLYAVAMSGNQLYSYDLTGTGPTLAGLSLGPLSKKAAKTDCRALCVGKDGVVWAGVAATFTGRGQFLHVCSYRPGANAKPQDHGPIAIGNPDYAQLTDAQGKVKKYHHGAYHVADDVLVPRYTIMGICAAKNGVVYVTTLYPFTVHAIRLPKVAGVTTIYRHNSHSDVIMTRLLKTDTLDGKGETPSLKLTSLFTDQVPKSDTSRLFAKQHGFQIQPTIPKTLTTKSGDRLAVDGVLLVAEHGDYPKSDTGQTVFPKRRMFNEIVKTFEKTGQVVPVFNDKHLADNWRDAKWMYDTAKRMKIPLMAGSSLPVLWRYPPVDVRRGAKLKQIVAVSYHTLDAYGFHAMELVQALAERRSGGETGIRSVQCFTGDAVWEAGRRGVYDQHLLEQCLARLKRPLEASKLPGRVKQPVLFVVDYNDGLRTNVLTLNGALTEWSAAWRYVEKDEVASTLFWTQEERPFHHFNHLLLGIEKMVHTGRPTWPVERTLLSSGTLDALLISKRDGGKKLTTPWLNIRYQSNWNWKQPAAPPTGRPIHSQ